MNELKSEATVGQLFGALASDTGALVRQEVQLAATEMTEKAKAAARSAGFIVAGGALLQVACIAVVLAVMAGLYPTVPRWASAAVLGLLFAGAGAILVRSGLSTLKHLGTGPSETVTTLRDNAAWAKEQVR
jgi:Putative Actinobacterial Holin-X, holin superfamily III